MAPSSALTRIVGRIDIINAKWADELDLHNRFLIAGPNIMGSLARDDGEGARL
jgi:hypothetical protein